MRETAGVSWRGGFLGDGFHRECDFMPGTLDRDLDKLYIVGQGRGQSPVKAL